MNDKEQAMLKAAQSFFAEAESDEPNILRMGAEAQDFVKNGTALAEASENGEPQVSDELWAAYNAAVPRELRATVMGGAFMLILQAAQS